MPAQMYATPTRRVSPPGGTTAATGNRNVHVNTGASNSVSSSSSSRRMSSSTLPPASSSSSSLSGSAAVEGAQAAYASNRDILLSSIESSKEILRDLRLFNQDRWIFHYPGFERQQATPSDDADHNGKVSSTHKGGHPSLLRAYSARPSAPTSAAVAPSSAPSTPARVLPVRSNSTALPPSSENRSRIKDTSDETSELSVLRLDLKMGGAAARDPSALVHSLGKSSRAQLLDGQMAQATRQLDNLGKRIGGTQSKVLVTGDLNAGKSTFVNALLRRNVMPIDQQPCTTVFCEVLDADLLNDGKEEVHLIRQGVCYDRSTESTFEVHSLEEIEQIVADAEDVSPDLAPMLKCYCRDTRSTQESLLRNGVVDIALIDAPGLNRDSLKTTALYARQEEIDVVVFVVSAENHFTLSAKEFLWNASNDKAYVFIVVNKFDQIRNKEKCKRLVLDQIKQLSPRTFEDADELVHFVDSNSVFEQMGDGRFSQQQNGDLFSSVAAATNPGWQTPTTPGDGPVPKISGTQEGSEVAGASHSLTAFANLESALRDFILLKRSKSKLLPAQTYILRLLADVEYLARSNTAVAIAEREEAAEKLEVLRPALMACQENQSRLQNQLENEEDDVVGFISGGTGEKLSRAVERIGKGLPALPSVQLPNYTGLFDVWSYAYNVRRTFVKSLDLALCEAEDEARSVTAEAVKRIKTVGEACLPEDAQRSERVFLPEAMFARRRRGATVRGNVSPAIGAGAGVSATGTVGLSLAGLGLNAEAVEVKVTDIFDFMYHFTAVSGYPKEKKIQDSGEKGTALSKTNDESSTAADMSVVSSFSVGLGALTLVGGKTMGAKSIVEAILRLADLVENKVVRKWAAPLFLVVTVGTIGWFIVDLPNSIPRNVGRSLKIQLSGFEAAAASERSRKAAKKAGIVGRGPDGAVEEKEKIGTSSVLPVTPSTTASAFIPSQTTRISNETRKVLRLANWDVQERFRTAIAGRKVEVERAELQERSAVEAIAWFKGVKGRVEEVKENTAGVRLLNVTGDKIEEGSKAVLGKSALGAVVESA